MTNEKKIELIKRYAPIFWIHQDDSFLPEDCSVMEQFAKIGKSSSDMKPFTLDELGDLPDSEDHYMDIPEIDFNNFGMDADYEGLEIGPERLALAVRNKFSNNRLLYPNAREPLPKYHARTAKIRIEEKDDPDSKFIRDHDPEVFGNYDVIQYYFFYIYNDTWNQHVSDWDSTLEIFVKENMLRSFALLHMHHVIWMMEFSGRPRKLNRWIDYWKRVEGKRMGGMFHYAVHPFVFVALGGHGGYPTPGFSIHGAKFFKTKIIAQTDYRQIGKLCILPDYEPVTEDAILKILKDANIDTTNTKFLPWEEPVILDKQPWLKYKGLWGTKSEYSGWGGSTGPSLKKCWRMNQRRFKRAYVKSALGDYKGSWPFKILKNWHGWL